MVDAAEVEEAISRTLTGLEQDPSIRMYLVAESKDIENPYVLYKVEPRGKVPELLKETLKRKSNDILARETDGKVKFKDFLQIHRNPGDVLIASASIVKDFQKMLDIINQKPNLPPPPNIKELTKIWGWAVEFDISDSRAIYFRKHTQTKLIGQADGNGRWPAELSNGELTDIDGNILTFDDHIDCVYFESLDSVMVIPPFSRFEEMFEFTDLFERETKKALKRLTSKNILILADVRLIDEAAKKKRMSRKITELTANKIIDQLEDGIITSYFFKATKEQVGEVITYTLNNNKIHIDDIKALGSFVDVCSHKYLKSMAGYREGADPLKFMADYKEPL